MSYLSQEQVEQLLRPINPKRVGKDGKGFSHLEAFDVRNHLNRIFGFGRWSADLLDIAQVFETATDGDKPRWTVCYRATVRLTLCAPDGTVLATYTEAACGDASNYPSRADANDMAIKTAESQAFKRCAVNLGDQYGASLYAKGSTNATVVRTLVMPGQVSEEPPAPVDAHVPEVVPESLAPDPAPDNHTQSEPPKEHTDEDERDALKEELRTTFLGATSRAEVAMAAAKMAKHKLATVHVDDGTGNVRALSVLSDEALKRVTDRNRGAA